MSRVVLAALMIVLATACFDAEAQATDCANPSTVIAIAPNDQGFLVELLVSPPDDYTVYPDAAVAVLQSLIREVTADTDARTLGPEVDSRLNSAKLKQSLNESVLAATREALIGSSTYSQCEVEVLQAPSDGSLERMWVSEQFDSTEAETILFVSPEALLETSMDRIRVTLTQRQYERRRHRSGKKAKPQDERQLIYVSGSRDIVQRSYREGEKDKAIVAMESELAEAVDPESGKPDKAAWQIEERLDAIRESDAVPMYIAVAEAWGHESADAYMPALVDHLSVLLRLAWDTPDRPANFRQSAVRFRFRSTIDDQQLTSRGVVVYEHKGHDVYRNFKDHLYSLPSDFAKRYPSGELIPR